MTGPHTHLSLPFAMGCVLLAVLVLAFTPAVAVDVPTVLVLFPASAVVDSVVLVVVTVVLPVVSAVVLPVVVGPPGPNTSSPLTVGR